MAIKLADVFVAVGAPPDQLNRDLGQAQQRVGTFGNFMQGIAQGIGQAFFNAMAQGVRKGIGVLVTSGREFIAFQNSMNQVFTLLPGVTEQAMGAMSKSVQNFVKEFGILPDLVGPALYQALSAGIPQDNVFSFLETAGRAAVGGVTRLETSVDGLTSVINAYGLSVDDAERVSDIFFATVRLGKTTFDEMARYAFQAVPIASALGISFAEVGAALALVTAQGVPTRVAFTQMRSVMSELSQEGTKANKIWMDLSGNMSVKEFKDRGGNFVQIMEMMLKGTNQLGIGVNDAFSSIEAGSFALAVTGGDNLQKFGALFDEINAATGETQSAFERMEQGIARSLDKIAGARSSFLVTLGTFFEPLMARFATLAVDAFDWGERMIQSYAGGIMASVNWVIRAVETLGRIIAYWLRPGSAPRFLPDLEAWGQGAVNAYMAGWRKADLGALTDLGRNVESIIRSFVGAGRIRETDLVSRVFGSRDAIMAAIEEFRRAGRVGESTIARIRDAAGPAGDALAGLVGAYFDLQTAARATADAQRELNEVTARYDAQLDPLKAKLRDLQDEQANLRDQSRIEELRGVLSSPRAGAAAHMAAALELEQLLLQQQIREIEREKRAALDAADEKIEALDAEQQAAQDAFDEQKALVDQQLVVNNLIAQESALRERLANEAIAAQKRALAELEAEQRKGEAAEKARLAELERVYQASLSYNMALADTEGKLALARLELGRMTEGSAEYFRQLELILGLERQLEGEREAAAKAAEKAGGTGLDLMADWEEQLETMMSGFDQMQGKAEETDDIIGRLLKREGIDVTADPGAGLPQGIKDAIDGFRDMGKLLKEDIIPALKELAPVLTVVADAFIGTKTTIVDVMQILGLTTDEELDGIKISWGEAVAFVVGLVTKLAKALGFLFNQIYASFVAVVGLFKALISGDWERAWELLKEIGRIKLETLAGIISFFFSETYTALTTWASQFLPSWATSWSKFGTTVATSLESTGTAIGTWFGDMVQAVVDWGSNLKEAGWGAMRNFFNGLKDYWDKIALPWWENSVLGKIVDMLPGSEPADASSPLRGLAKRGEAIMQNLQAGIDRASLTIAPNLAGLAGEFGGMSGSTVTNNSPMTVNLTINAPGGDPQTVARSAEIGLRRALQAKGQR